MVTIVDEAPLVNDFLYYCVASGPSFAAGRKPSYSCQVFSSVLVARDARLIQFDFDTD